MRCKVKDIHICSSTNYLGKADSMHTFQKWNLLIVPKRWLPNFSMCCIILFKRQKKINKVLHLHTS